MNHLCVENNCGDMEILNLDNNTRGELVSAELCVTDLIQAEARISFQGLSSFGYRKKVGELQREAGLGRAYRVEGGHKLFYLPGWTLPSSVNSFSLRSCPRCRQPSIAAQTLLLYTTNDSRIIFCKEPIFNGRGNHDQLLKKPRC
ncbi:uncharacterized protein [Triticum aestivum]|uniref:uncharacterized protein n=1 Tax=Triticum aestivum TaxID=4565 RepID=UPI001D026823|nr:uncharacterized protein LOC123162027 [Triticum aestivum]XP_044435776.1 uncharacterized protein LOC123162027 [Triticum aestivum]